MFGPASEPVINPVRQVALGIALVTAVVLVIFFIRNWPETAETPATTQSSTEQDNSTDARPPPQALPTPVQTETLTDVRQVIPGRAVHVPSAGQDVVRLPAPPVVAPPPRPVNLGIVVVEAANRLSTRRGMVTLAGTQGIDEQATCQLDDGRTPPCHVLARTAVRRFVGQRQISCTLSLRDDAGEDHVAPCLMADADLALWVVAQGWAFADGAADATMLAAQSIARQEQRGLWGTVGGQRMVQTGANR
ncbi:MAG: hypothetical protein Rhims3KO_05000 [Hyphomicrobiales bacterium]